MESLSENPAGQKMLCLSVGFVLFNIVAANRGGRWSWTLQSLKRLGECLHMPFLKVWFWMIRPLAL